MAVSASASVPSRDAARAADAADPLAGLRDAFALPDGIVYLDGNSLGALPRRTAARVARTVEAEWGEGLIRSWNSAGWIDLASAVGESIGRLIGAGPAEVSVGDSTSVNLFKALGAAVDLQRRDAPGRKAIVSERENFPTDLYIAESIAAAHGLELRLADSAASIGPLLDDDLAVLVLTHVNYRSGAMHDLAALTRAAHAAGGLVVWDLAHSAGAVPLDLAGADADFAVGCGYKYLNGGPGAPAFVWAHARQLARMDRDALRQPLSGWLGHAEPFAFAPAYQPAAGVGRFVCGTPPIVALRALQCGVEVFDDAAASGGMAALRAKSIALAELFIDRVEATCPGLALASPREARLRGSQVSFAHEHGYAVMQALIERGVVGDFRAGDPQAGSPDLLRFGLTPLYTRFVDVWDAAEVLADVVRGDAWRAPRHARRAAVT
jgi:kynureninase